MTPTDLKRFLRDRVPLFEDFDAANIDRIAEASELRAFEGSEAIIECGEEGRFFGVTVSSHAKVSLVRSTG